MVERGPMNWNLRLINPKALSEFSTLIAIVLGEDYKIEKELY